MLDFYLFSGLKNKGTKEKDSITDSFEKVDPSETLFLIGSNSINWDNLEWLLKKITLLTETKLKK